MSEYCLTQTGVLGDPYCTSGIKVAPHYHQLLVGRTQVVQVLVVLAALLASTAVVLPVQYWQYILVQGLSLPNALHIAPPKIKIRQNK